MEQIVNYVKPELIVVAIALYFVGMALKQAQAVKDKYIQLATAISYKSADGEIVNCEHDTIGNKAIAFIGTSGVQMGWLASQADMLAEDWIFVK